LTARLESPAPQVASLTPQTTGGFAGTPGDRVVGVTVERSVL
jgi:hypothetical protein